MPTDNTDTREQAQPINVEADAATKLSDAADTLRIWSMAGDSFDDEAEKHRRALAMAMASMCDEMGLSQIGADLLDAAENAFGIEGASS